MELPTDFVHLMHEHYDASVADALCTALGESEPAVSIRLNPYKWQSNWHLPKDTEPVSWCPGAYYLQERPAFTFDPLLHAGAYYVQEASSMYIATLIQKYYMVDSPQACLDLCAAPGGKSTLLASLLPKGSLLISNEPMPKRAQVLAENMQKWTRMPQGQSYPVRSLVSRNYPADFGALTDAFNLIVTDVPCSGEGMFRKDEGAIRDWSLENVELCWRRQRDILNDIWHALQPGGLLLYSTCTFNRYEDEDNARWICNELGGELLEERHFLPGRDRGEGFYVATIRKNGQPETVSTDIESVAKKAQKTLYLLPPAFECEGPEVNVSYDEALQYLRREVVRVEAPRGIVTLCYQGLPLGTGKSVGNRINNLYPQEWRIRTTYTKKYSLLFETKN